MYDVATVRKDFPILSRQVHGKPLVYLDNAATSQKPQAVIDAWVDYYTRHNANVHRGVHTLSVEATEAYEAAREKIARFFNVPAPEQLLFTRNTTEAINLVAMAWASANVKAGDEIVVSEVEHHSNLVPWQRVCEVTGATLKLIKVKPDYTLDFSDLDRTLTARTKLVAITQQSNVLGTIVPVKPVMDAARRVGALVLVDGAQSAPHSKVDVQAMDCDFFAFSGHKMLAPMGIGGLYVKRGVLEAMEPFLRGGEMVLEVTYERATWADLPYKFEAGTPNVADAIALSAAVEYLSRLGMDEIRQHEVALTKHALERMREIEEITTFGPTDLSLRGGVISFYMADVHPHDIGTVLDREGIAIRTGHHCAMPLVRSRLNVPATARASFYLYNTEAEVDALIEALKKTQRYFGNAHARRA
ncbi:MAG: cysteine desulfurase [SAR202 cluster bacterium]|nr:cysteine desulfurase [SAR202 cluster bacterium]